MELKRKKRVYMVEITESEIGETDLTGLSVGCLVDAGEVRT